MGLLEAGNHAPTPRPDLSGRAETSGIGASWSAAFPAALQFRSVLTLWHLLQYSDERSPHFQLRQYESYLNLQNVNFSATWPIRGSRADLTVPKELESVAPFGLLNCAWLKALNNSARNSTDIRSVA